MFEDEDGVPACMNCGHRSYPSFVEEFKLRVLPPPEPDDEDDVYGDQRKFNSKSRTHLDGFLTVSEIAEEIGIHPNEVRRRIAKLGIETCQLKGVLVVPDTELVNLTA